MEAILMSTSDPEGPSKANKEEILSHLKQIAIEKLELTPEQISRIRLDAPLVEILELDSLAQVVFIFEIEDHYGFTFELEEREQLHTIEDLVKVIQARAHKA